MEQPWLGVANTHLLSVQELKFGMEQHTKLVMVKKV